jgi:hypothetical protein
VPAEPPVNRTVAFVDGQDLVHAARSAFGYTYPNYDIGARVISGEQNRWIKIASAFPDSPAARNHRGINSTDWIRIDRAAYDACIDPRDYRV